MCTTALFFSGYAIQQRTLRNLRAAIRAPPEPSPKIFLPDRFRKTTTELEDGTVVVLGNDDDDDDVDDRNEDDDGLRRGGDVVVVQIRPSGMIEDDTQDERGRPLDLPPPPPVAEKQNESEEEEKEEGENRMLFDPKPEPWKAQKPVMGPEPASSLPSPDGKAEDKPVSRAERRRRIKEEIHRLAMGDTPIYYQRRLY